MSVGYEALFFGLIVHSALAFSIGFLFSMIPRKLIGLVAFVLFYSAIAVWYTASFNFQMLIYSTYFVLYVIVGLVGFTCGSFWFGRRGQYKKSHSKKKVVSHDET